MSCERNRSADSGFGQQGRHGAGIQRPPDEFLDSGMGRLAAPRLGACRDRHGAQRRMAGDGMKALATVLVMALVVAVFVADLIGAWYEVTP